MDTRSPVAALPAAMPVEAGAYRSPLVLNSTDLLGSRQSIDIEHNGQRYRLQTTKAGKLILTK